MSRLDSTQAKSPQKEQRMVARARVCRKITVNAEVVRTFHEVTLLANRGVAARHDGACAQELAAGGCPLRSHGGHQRPGSAGAEHGSRAHARAPASRTLYDGEIIHVHGNRRTAPSRLIDSIRSWLVVLEGEADFVAPINPKRARECARTGRPRKRGASAQPPRAAHNPFAALAPARLGAMLPARRPSS